MFLNGRNFIKKCTVKIFYINNKNIGDLKMEEKKNVVNMHPKTEKPSYEQLQAQLMQAQQTIAAIRMDAQKKIESMNYANAFQQQQFMMEIVKMHDLFPADMVTKAINAIDNFWFEEPKEEGTNNEQKQS